jgi:hypothetical protein
MLRASRRAVGGGLGTLPRRDGGYIIAATRVTRPREPSLPLHLSPFSIPVSAALPLVSAAAPVFAEGVHVAHEQAGRGRAAGDAAPARGRPDDGRHPSLDQRQRDLFKKHDTYSMDYTLHDAWDGRVCQLPLNQRQRDLPATKKRRCKLELVTTCTRLVCRCMRHLGTKAGGRPDDGHHPLLISARGICPREGKIQWMHRRQRPVIRAGGIYSRQRRLSYSIRSTSGVPETCARKEPLATGQYTARA